MSNAPLDIISPNIPEPLHFPFYYASLQCIWVYWETSVDAADFDTRLTPTRFGAAGGEAAGVVLNFQRYTAHLPGGLAVTNEVEFNLICQPRSAATTPRLTLCDYLRGADPTGFLGQLRLHVAADNAFAVWAGRQGFGENKFDAKFLYAAPTLNDPASAGRWSTRLYRAEQIETRDNQDQAKAGEADRYLYALEADLSGLATAAVTATPITEFALGLGRTVVTRWTLLGTFQAAALDAASADRCVFRIGPGQTGEDEAFARMRLDLAELIGSRAAAGVQTFESPPACVEPPGWFLDA